jgi:hypothetical protein
MTEMKPSLWRDFLRVLETVPPGRHVSSNVLRDLLAAADIPERTRGGLFSQAVRQGYLRPVSTRCEASTGETAKRALVRVYKRTRVTA